MAKFRDVLVGETFDFIADDDQRMFNSFFERCTKISARMYSWIKGGRTLAARVGSIDVEVYNIRAETLDLQRPIRSERRRGFQPPWYTVYIYKCETCGHETAIRANSFRGRDPVPGVGAIVCPRCDQ